MTAPRHRRPRLWGIASLLILAAFAAWTVWYVAGHWGEFAAIRQVSLTDLASLYGALVVLLAINGLFLKEATAVFAVDLRPAEWASLSAFSSFANYFLPFRGGAGLRALYLATVHRLHLADFMTMLSAMFLMQAVINACLVLAGMILLSARGGPFDPALGVFFAAVAATALLLAAVPAAALPATARFPWPQFRRVAAGWRRLHQDRPAVRRLWLLSLAFAAATLWQCGQAFSAIGAPLPMDGLLVYAGAKNVAFLAALTPGSLGVVEAMSVYLGRSLDYSPAQALLVQGLIRAVSLSALLVAGPLAFQVLRRRLVEGGGTSGGAEWAPE